MGDFTAPPPNNAPVAIYEDGGGLVNKYREMALRYRLEIVGSCRSACVLALSVPTVCVMPGAVVKAHQAYEQDTGRARPDITYQMMSSLPDQIRARLEPNITREYNSKTTLRYRDLVSLGVKSCNTVASDNVRMVKVKQKTVTSNPIADLFSTIRRKFNGTP
jgi:hypothetical protein